VHVCVCGRGFKGGFRRHTSQRGRGAAGGHFHTLPTPTCVWQYSSASTVSAMYCRATSSSRAPIFRIRLRGVSVGGRGRGEHHKGASDGVGEVEEAGPRPRPVHQSFEKGCGDCVWGMVASPDTLLTKLPSPPSFSPAALSHLKQSPPGRYSMTM
jgi:hypothetical protein